MSDTYLMIEIWSIIVLFFCLTSECLLLSFICVGSTHELCKPYLWPVIKLVSDSNE